MATFSEQIVTTAPSDRVWDAIRDVGALHTRLVPGFVVDTRLVPGARIVTFGTGMVVREPIVAVDERARRVVWSADTDQVTHYNASVQVFDEGAGSRVVWTTDFLPDDAAGWLREVTRQGMATMKATLDAHQGDAIPGRG
jgi:hypothetical protein